MSVVFSTDTMDRLVSNKIVLMFDPVAISRDWTALAFLTNCSRRSMQCTAAPGCKATDKPR